jgi:hypothetical protein
MSGPGKPSYRDLWYRTRCLRCTVDGRLLTVYARKTSTAWIGWHEGDNIRDNEQKIEITWLRGLFRDQEEIETDD